MSTTVPFGKYRGCTLADVAAENPGYLDWMLRTAAEPGCGPAIAFFVEDHREDIIAAMCGPSPDLNPSQRAAVEHIASELLDGSQVAHRLEGGAGYGKSYAVRAVTALALALGYRVAACATSYVATQVLAQQLPGITVRTIASALRLTKVYVEDREEYVPGEDTPGELARLCGRQRLLVVDEYSMVNDELGELMLAAARENGGKILFVGDLHQLPPVGQDTPTTLALIPGHSTLTEPMRYSRESDLYQVEQAARHRPHDLPAMDWSQSSEVHEHTTLAELVDRYVEDTLEHPGDDHRMTFYRRADVQAANARIRRKLFGEVADSRPLVDGEAVMIMSTVTVSCDPMAPGARISPDTGHATRRFYSGQKYLAEECTSGHTTVELVPKDSNTPAVQVTIPCHRVKFQGDPTRYPVMFSTDVSDVMDGTRGAADIKSALQAWRAYAKDTRDWGPWRTLKRAFLPVGYGYAMTVHRVQGQTVHRAYVDPSALAGSDIAPALSYVALTRAKSELHMVK